jgi:protein ImuA
MPADASALIAGLRQEIRRIERRPAQRPAHAASGVAGVDAVLPGGGFPCGTLCELIGGPASGKTALALRTLRRAMGEGGLGAFVDGRGELYPPAAAALGLDLGRLLLVRATGEPAGDGARGAPGDAARQALWCAEVVLASGAFAAVAVDVPLPSRGVGAAALDGMLRRLRAAAERGGAAALWLATPEGPRFPGALRYEVTCGADGPEVRPARGGAALPERAPWGVMARGLPDGRGAASDLAAGGVVPALALDGRTAAHLARAVQRPLPLGGGEVSHAA